MKNYRTLFLLMLALSVSGMTRAQNKKINYSKEPVWIKMMDDTTANYFEVVKAYNTFWADRIKPETENDVIGEKPNSKTEKHHPLFRSKKEKQKEENEKYSFACEKYEHWKIITKPFVQEDGHILTPHERILQWKKGN